MAIECSEGIELKAELEKQIALGDQYLVVTFRRPPGFTFSAGQHTTLSMEDDGGTFQRTYSIASSPSSSGVLEFCIQVQNDGRTAAFLKNLRSTSVVHLTPAQGTFKISRHSTSKIFIAGGSGISPIRSFLLELLSKGKPAHPISLVYGCSDASAIPFKDEWLSLSRISNDFKIYLAAEKSRQGFQFGKMKIYQGNVLDVFKLNPGLLDSVSDYYACGPSGMMKALKDLLFASGIEKNRFFEEKYS